MEVQYKGLSNSGATCYMNSLLQTLFMTPAFREKIYKWTYNAKQHPKKEDCIIYQLQKIFYKLEIKYPYDINTKELTKSFQWSQEDVHNQQDIQEFNRILFQAIEKSIYNAHNNHPHNNNHNNHHFIIKELYQGELLHYTKCLECNIESIREECFEDIIVHIKNIYEKVYNKNIQIGIQRYMKPEFLDQNNLYDCSHCQKKVKAERGVRFIKMPKLLNIILQRFNFDYNTMTRNKINDRVQFPFILNFNNYMNGYDQIPEKQDQNCSEYFLKDEFMNNKPVFQRKPISTKTLNTRIAQNKNNNQPSVAGKVTTKPSANTKSFLQEMRKKKMGNQTEDLLFVSGDASIHSQNHLPNGNTVQKAEAKKQNLEIKKQQSKEQLNHPDLSSLPSLSTSELFIPLPPPPLLLPPPSLSEPYRKLDTLPPETMEKQLQKFIFEKETLGSERNKNLEERQQKNAAQIQKYLKEGPLVYELYAILIHNGTASSGHYICYIKSFQNKKWYCFNDERVSEINVLEIQKTFSLNGSNSSAYALYYKQVSSEFQSILYSAPEYIKKCIKQQLDINKNRQIQKINNIQNVLTLKIYSELHVKTIEISKQTKFEVLFQQALLLFNIKLLEQNLNSMADESFSNKTQYFERENIRLRLYNPVSDQKLNTYDKKEENTLEELGIYSYNVFLLQKKNHGECFQKYLEGFITVKLSIHAPTQQNRKRTIDASIYINKDITVKQLQNYIKNSHETLANINICIIKKHLNDQFIYHEILNYFENEEQSLKCISVIPIIEGEVLFIQENQNQLYWPQEFQDQLYKIQVKYILEESEHTNQSLIANSTHQTITTDSRKTLEEFKGVLCEVLRKLPEEIILKRGNRNGLQIKNEKQTLKENRFINGTQLYLENGIPAKIGEIRIQLFLAQEAHIETYNRLHQFQWLGDIPISVSMKASEVKNVFIQFLHKKKGILLKAQQFRIREKVNDKLGKIYREKPMKQQQLIEKRQIAIENITDVGLEIKDYSVYVRVWDVKEWKLSQKIEILVNKNIGMRQFAEMIQQESLKLVCKDTNMEIENNNKIAVDCMQICRILSIHKFSILDLVEMEYFQMDSDLSVFGEPLFVNSDGLLYIVKDFTLEPRSLTKEEEVIFGGKLKPLHQKVRVRPVLPQKKQKSMTIKVVQKEIQENQKIVEEKEPEKEKQ